MDGDEARLRLAVEGSGEGKPGGGGGGSGGGGGGGWVGGGGGDGGKDGGVQPSRLFDDSQPMAQLSPEVCLGSAWGLPGVCLGSTWGLPGVYLGSAWGLPGVCLGSAWGLPGACLEPLLVKSRCQPATPAKPSATSPTLNSPEPAPCHAT